MRPIDVWPARKFTGRPGYSAAYFARMAGSQEDPLRVAATIRRNQTAEAIREQFAAEPPPETTEGWSGRADRVSKAMSEADEKSWADLCSSFDAVISALASEKQTPVIKRLLAEARRARAQAERGAA
jgi:hypothetical protein